MVMVAPALDLDLATVPVPHRVISSPWWTFWTHFVATCQRCRGFDLRRIADQLDCLKSVLLGERPRIADYVCFIR